MKLNLFRFLICFEFVIFYFGFTSSISASVGMSISPPVTEILISPNKSVSTTIQLTNDGDDTSVILSLHRLIPQGDQGHSTIDTKPLDPTSIPIVIKLVGKELGIPFKLSAGQTLPITIELEAANLDEPTDVYFAILARGVNEGASPTESQATPGITALFMTTITPSASLPTNIALVPPELPVIQDTTKTLDFEVKAENKTGNMLQVQGKIKLTSPNKTVIRESTFDPKLVLGNTTRQLTNFEFLISNFTLGPHTITIELSTISGRTLTEHSYVVWFLPLRYLIITTVALILLLIPLSRKKILDKERDKSLK